MKRGWQKWLATALAVVMVFSIMPRVTFAQDDNLLTNGSFETDFWEDHSWSVVPENWGTQETVTAKWSSDAAYEGTYAFHYWSESAQVMTISQTVTLTAGSYTLSFRNQGASATVQGFIGTMDGKAVTPTGWGTWDGVSDGFTVTADGDYTVGVRLNLSDGGWGDLDELRLVKQSGQATPTDGLYVTPGTVSAEAGDTLSFTAQWVSGGAAAGAVPEGYSLWWWLDSWNEHQDGNTDGVLSNDNGSGKTLTCGLTVPSEGTYYLAAELKQGDTQVAITYATVTVTAAPAAVEDNLNVSRIKFQNSGFIRGMDVSSVLALEQSGVKFYDENGVEGDLFKILADNGVNYIRVRVWNNPYDSQGMGYGGGNNDVAKAAAIGKRAADNGMKLLVDFHYSDFWADPGKQKTPKAWANMTVDQKAQAVQTFTADALTAIKNAGADVGMVQIGNETTQSICGESTWANMAKIYNAGAAAVRAFDKDVLVAVHFTNPEKTAAMKGLADKLHENNVDYDVFATSYYPYWHGSLTNLTAVLDYAATTYGKYAMVAETSYAYTLDDSDGFDNTVSRLGNNVGDNLLWPFTPQGQATEVREVMNAVNNVSGGKGLGVFYWEGAWVTVGDTTGLTGDDLADKRKANSALWEQNGVGWAASYASEYDPNDAGKWYGGSAVDNQAFFGPDGVMLRSLKVFKYVETGAVNTLLSVESVEAPVLTVTEGQAVTLPGTLAVTYSDSQEPVAETVVWNADDVAALADAKGGQSCTVHGTVTLSRTAEDGDYKGLTSAPVTCTVTVKHVNLLPGDDVSFEGGSGPFTLQNAAITTDDPFEGAHAVHWYLKNGGTGTVIYKGPQGAGVTLPEGTYTFAVKAQGNSGEAVRLSVTDGSATLATGTDTALTGWAAWQESTVTFTLTRETAVYPTMTIAIQPGGWGTLDAMELYAVVAETAADNQRPTARENLMYTGQALALVNPPKEALPGYAIRYSLDGTTWTETVATATDAGDYTVHARYEGNSTHPGTLALEDISVTIAKAPGQATAPELRWSMPGSTEGQGEERQFYTVGIEGKEGQVYVIAPQGQEPDWSAAAAPDEDGLVAFSGLDAATTYDIYTRTAGDGNHTEATAKLTYTTGLYSVSKAGYDYVGETITVTPEPEDAPGLTYRWYHAKASEELGMVREETPISGAESASYTITQEDLGWYLCVEIRKNGASLMESEFGPVTYWPARFLTVTLSADALTGDGTKAVGPAVTVKADELVLTQGKDYTLSGQLTSAAFGTHTITVTGCGRFEGTHDITWTLSAAESRKETREDAWGKPIVTDTVSVPGAPAAAVSAITPAKALALLGEDSYYASPSLLFYLQAESRTYAQLSGAEVNALADLRRASAGLQMGQYMALRFYCREGDGAAQALTELNESVTVSVTIPDALRNAPTGFRRTFTLVRVHDGVAMALPTTRSGNVLTAATDRFSTYVIAYQDTPLWTPAADGPVNSAATGDHGVVLWSVLVLCSALALPVVTRRRRAE